MQALVAPSNGNPLLCFLPCLPTGPGILVGWLRKRVLVSKLLALTYGFCRKSFIKVCFLADLDGNVGVSSNAIVAI